MKLLSALFDTALLPFSIAADLVTAPVDVFINGEKSKTRQRIEAIEENLRP